MEEHSNPSFAEKRDLFVFALAFGLIFVVGAFLRFHGLPGAGIFGVDDGRYVLDGLAKANEFRFGWELVEAKRAEMAGGPELLLADALPDAMDALADPHPFSPKLGYAYAIAAVLLPDFTVSAGNYVEAFFGTLLIAITFGFVRYVAHARAALVAAAFVSVSAYCVYFSRNTYPQCISACFVVAALWMHVAWLRREGSFWWLFGSGVMAGLSFWTNYQSAAALPLVAVVHLLVCVRRVRGIRTFVFGGFAIFGGFALVLAAAEAVTYPMLILFRSQGLAYPQATFFEVLWPRFTGQTSVPFNAAGLVLFPYFLGLFHGWSGTAALLLLLGAGFVIGLRQRDESRTGVALYFAVAFLVPFTLFSLKTMQGARMFMYALPLFAALAGVAVSLAWSVDGRWRTASRAFVVVASLVFLGSNAVALWEVRSIRSAYPEVIAFLQQRPDSESSAAWSSTLRCYLLESGLEGGDLYRYLGEGKAPPRWFVNDWQEFYGGRYPDEPIALESGATPAHEFSHAIGRIFLEVEALPSHGDTFENLRWVRALDLERSRKLLVYDLTQTSLRGNSAD